jgi:RimJ/RimL family protein N-acetyltransferase
MTLIAAGDNIVLRDRIRSDVDTFIYWQTHGEWRLLDAPWEGVWSSLTEEKETELRRQFLESCSEGLPSPRKTVIIAGQDNLPIGWVTSYSVERKPDTLMVGIDICEDNMLNEGLGMEALGLWVDYLFSNSTLHRIGLDTWSFNPRMRRVAEKLGFVAEGRQREMLQWDGKWLDLVHFGMLRAEWEDKHSKRWFGIIYHTGGA